MEVRSFAEPVSEPVATALPASIVSPGPLLNVGALRHDKEKTYFALAAVFGVMGWISLLIVTFGTLILYGLFVALGMWIAERMFVAIVMGQTVRVTERQYPEIHAILRAKAAQMGIAEPPKTFVVAGQGVLNAFAARFLTGRYIVLFGELVDLYLTRGEWSELGMVISHELAHHAAGHLTWWRRLLVAPAKLVPFLGGAYSRACELTADRIGATAIADLNAARRALVGMSTGSAFLAPRTDLGAFVDQEREVPEFFGLIVDLLATHPRMTRRILALDQLRGF